MAGKTVRRKLHTESTHDYHHYLLEVREVYWRSLPRRSGVDKVRRREAGKAAWWTLTGHLRSQHAYKGTFLRMTWEQVAEIHRQYHEQGEPNGDSY